MLFECQTAALVHRVGAAVLELLIVQKRVRASGDDFVRKHGRLGDTDAAEEGVPRALAGAGWQCVAMKWPVRIVMAVASVIDCVGGGDRTALQPIRARVGVDLGSDSRGSRPAATGGRPA